MAARLDAADPCGATEHATALQQQAIAATNGPAVPAALKEPLLSSVSDLVDRVGQECANTTPPAPPPETTTTVEEHGKGKKKGHKKHGKKHQEDDAGDEQ